MGLFLANRIFFPFLLPVYVERKFGNQAQIATYAIFE